MSESHVVAEKRRLTTMAAPVRSAANTLAVSALVWNIGIAL
jgi:hypothetical protein